MVRAAVREGLDNCLTRIRRQGGDMILGPCSVRIPGFSRASLGIIAQESVSSNYNHKIRLFVKDNISAQQKSPVPDRYHLLI